MAFLIDTIDTSGLFAQSANSATIATKDSNGNDITATYQPIGDYYSASNPSGFISDVPAGTMNESAFGFDLGYISSYNGSAFKSDPLPAISSYDLSAGNGINIVKIDAERAIGIEVTGGGGDVPSGVMAESGLGFNAVNEISGYNGSAIAQYGAEKQWLQHDDTLVHAANSAQYALGVNLSAVAQLLGIDETLLWSGTITAVNNPITLTEPYTAFDKIKFTFDIDNTKVDVIQPVIKNSTVTTEFGNYYGAAKANAGGWWNCWDIVKFSADNSCTITAAKALLWGANSTSSAPSNVYNDWTWTVRNLCEIRGIGRKQ